MHGLELKTFMAGTLGRIIQDQQIASAIYFTPASIDVRVKVVDSALLQFCAIHPAGILVIEHWRKIILLLNRLRKTRNKVAHSAIMIYHPGNDKLSFARLRFPVLHPDESDREIFLKGGKPGMGSNELNIAVAAASGAAGKVANFMEFIPLIRPGDHATLLQRLRAAEGEGPNLPDPGNQTPQESEPPPPPSPE